MSSADRSASSCGALLGAELAQRFHRELAVLLDERVEGRVALFFGQLGEDLGEVGGVLLLEEVERGWAWRPSAAGAAPTRE